jgi:1,4-alpha-glucan branching enzyme
MLPLKLMTATGRRELRELLASLERDLQRIADARHHDPHAILGRHLLGGTEYAIVYLPATRQVRLHRAHAAQRLRATDFFVWSGPAGTLPPRYTISREDDQGGLHEFHDPYCFPPQISDPELASFNNGSHRRIHRMLGAHAREVDGVGGTQFAVWAPHAERASVVGPFNLWDGRRHAMRVRGSSGVWEIFVPGIGPGTLYKFELRNRDNGTVHLKTDPCGRQFELRPADAAFVASNTSHEWRDSEWMERRRTQPWLHAPMSIYEVHLASWQRAQDGGFLSYAELAERLIPHLRDHGFTHVEFLPLTEHPLDDSWGYQTTGYFAATSRHGEAEGLKLLIDRCHQAGIGVILDWVPAHFPRDTHALARYDGEPLFEYSDPRKAEHLDWGTLVFDYSKHEVRAFLLSSACYWLEEFHVDGLRVDAVASMLYLDYSRRAGDFVPNRYGGNHNLEAVDFLKELNSVTHLDFPGTVTLAEESTEWPLVSRPVADGGLGFSMKWNMGWMHDTLAYMKEDPLYRVHHHQKLTFGMMYAYSENFVLPFSHDEVVHLKGSLYARMPGDEWQKFANLRLLYAYQWSYPGKKLLFMGGEFAQPTEWNFRVGLPWHLAGEERRLGVRALIRDLNALYRAERALHAHEFEPRGFRWIDPDDRSHSVLTFLRIADEDPVRGDFLVVALNFTPVPRERFRIGVPRTGQYAEIFNSDSKFYGGSNLGNPLPVTAQRMRTHGHEQTIEVTLPPLAGVILRPV